MECRKRSIQDSDFNEVYRICMHTSVIPFLSFEPMSSEHFRDVFSRLNQANGFFAFDTSTHLGGFVHIERRAGRSDHVAMLSTLAVDPALHGSGFAVHMLASILAHLKTSGVRRVELAVEADNQRALRFYRRTGFEIEGTLRRAYRRAHESCDIDSHMMGLLLA